MSSDLNPPGFTAEAALYTERGYYQSGDSSTQTNSSILLGVEAAVSFDGPGNGLFPDDPWAVCINRCRSRCSLRPVSQQQDCQIDCALGCIGFDSKLAHEWRKQQ